MDLKSTNENQEIYDVSNISDMPEEDKIPNFDQAQENLSEKNNLENKSDSISNKTSDYNKVENKTDDQNPETSSSNLPAKVSSIKSLTGLRDSEVELMRSFDEETIENLNDQKEKIVFNEFHDSDADSIAISLKSDVADTFEQKETTEKSEKEVKKKENNSR